MRFRPYVLVCVFILSIVLVQVIGAGTNEYYVGSFFKKDLEEFGSGPIIAKVTTPSGEYFVKELQGIFVYGFEEPGNHKIEITSRDKRWRQTFLVHNPLQSDPLYQDIDKIGYKSYNSNITRPIDSVVNGPIRVGVPVVWEKEVGSDELLSRVVNLPVYADKIGVDAFESVTLSGPGQVSQLRETFNGLPEKSFEILGATQPFKVRYETPAPLQDERFISDRIKEISVYSEEEYGYLGVHTKTNISVRVPVSSSGAISVWWDQGKTELPFQVLDVDFDGFIDEVSWVVPHLSNQTFLIIIKIIGAEHLDSQRAFLEDVYNETYLLDGIWSPEIADGEYVRVMFEENLSNQKDITIYPRVLSGDPRLEVYRRGGSVKIAEFQNIQSDFYNTVFLTQLLGLEDQFDLRVVGGSMVFDHIIDPTAQPSGSIELRAQNAARQDSQQVRNLFESAPLGSYPAACGSSGDRLSCDDNIFETSNSIRVGGGGGYNGFGGVNVSSYNSTIINCDTIDQVLLYYEFWGSSSQHACSVGVDANGGASWSDTSVTCSATAPGVAVLNVTDSEAWTCSNFFGLSGTRSLARAQAQKTGGGGTQLWNFDVLYFEVTYTEQINNIEILLNSPPSGSYDSDGVVVFNYTPSILTGNFDSCRLYDNSSGVFAINQTNQTAVVNGSQNLFTQSYADGMYLWNIECCDGASCYVPNLNQTVIVDTRPPLWSTLSANNSSPDPLVNVSFEANWSDSVGLNAWTFFWDVGSGFVPAGSGTFSGSSSGTSFITKIIPSSMEGQDLFYYFRATDNAGLQNQTSGNDFVSVNDITNPSINLHSVNDSSVLRFDPVSITANVTDNIGVGEVIAQVSLPNGSFVNVTLANVLSNIWEATYSGGIIGGYNYSVYANDTSGNSQVSSVGFWNVSGRSNVSVLYPNGGSFGQGSQISLQCLVGDADLNSPVENYLVSFYADGTFLGSNTTNQTGVSSFGWAVQGPSVTRINCTTSDDPSLYYVSNVANDFTDISVVFPSMVVTDVVHENKVSSNEYDVGGIIDWVNVSVSSVGQATAQSANVTLSLLYPNGSVASWFPVSVYECGDVINGSVCEAEFTNGGLGFLVGGSLSGLYNFNASVVWGGGGSPPSVNVSQTNIFYVPENSSGLLLEPAISPGTNTTYEFNLTNPLSGNLSLVNATVSCPAILGLLCYDSITGLQTSQLGAISSGLLSTVRFNVTTTSSSPTGSYGLNVTLEYSNPDGESVIFTGVGFDTLVLQPLLTTINNSPAKVNRGNTTIIEGYATNLGNEVISDVNLSWSVPFGWLNNSGSFYSQVSSLNALDAIVSLVNVTIGVSSSLGLVPVNLTADSANTSQSVASREVEVWAYTYVSLLSANNTSPLVGEKIRLDSRLVYDNGSALSGQVVSFNSTLNATTNLSGDVVVDFTLPSNASIGPYEVTASFIGNSSLYLEASSNSTNVTIQDFIYIDEWTTQAVEGYGRNVTINANVTSTEPADTVIANITSPQGSNYLEELSFVSGDTYSVVFSQTWETGQYNYTIFANNTVGTSNVTDPAQSFEIRGNFTLIIDTLTDFYLSNQLVNLTHPSDIQTIPPQSFVAGPSGERDLRAQGAAEQNDQNAQNLFPDVTQGDYNNNTCGSAGDRLSCDDSIVETATSNRGAGSNQFGGLNITSFSPAVSNCANISQVLLYYEFWGASSQHTCTVGVDANGGASWSDTTVTCSATAPGVAVLNVTDSEAWTCSNFFGLSGTRALAKAQAQRTAGGGSQLWNFDVLYFEVTYEDSGFVDSRQASLITNIGPTNANGYFLMTIESNESGTWETFDTVLNDTNTSTLRSVNSLSSLNLSDYWNGEAGGWPSNKGSGGDYRARVSLVSPSGSTIVDSSNSQVSSFTSFQIDNAPPLTYLVSPSNASVNVGTSITVAYNSTDLSGVSNCSIFHDKSGSFTLEETKPFVEGIDNNFTIVGFTENTNITWNVQCTDQASNVGSSQNGPLQFTMIVPPDFQVNRSAVTINNQSEVVEGVNYTLSANVSNIGGQASLTVVNFYDGDPDFGGVLIGNDSVYVDVGQTNVSSTVWTASVGPNELFVHVDPPLATNGTVSEIREDNNEANLTVVVGAWQELYGNASISISLGDASSSELDAWGNDTLLDGNIFIVDTEASIDWASVFALGRDSSETISSNDFFELDQVLGMENFTDSVSNLFTSSQVPFRTANLTVQGSLISNVPVINSTITESFQTGILWDSSDDVGDGEYDSIDREDVVFVSPFNRGMGGLYGTYDYEVTIPSKLREYNPSDNGDVYLYVSLN